MTPSSQTRSTRSVIAALCAAGLGLAAIGITSAATASTTSDSTRATAPKSAQSSPPPSLTWAGRKWDLFASPRTGPDSVPMSAKKAAAHVDAKGRLHLAMTKVSGQWRSVELYDPKPLKFGTYTFVTSTPLYNLAKPLDFGMFTYRPGSKFLTDEIDLEDSRALVGMHHGLNAQYVIQPYTKKNHIKRYTISRKSKIVQQQFTWTKSDAKFVTRVGAGPHARVLKKFHFHGSDVPTLKGEVLYIVLFIHGGEGKKVAPGNHSVVLNSFTFKPAK